MSNANLLAVLHSHDIRNRLRSIGWRWEDLCLQADSVFVFGSLAASPARSFNDIDLLCVGNGRTRITKEIDLIWLRQESVEGRDWLESELAGHVACYGVCLKGDFKWRRRVSVGYRSVLRKREAIHQHLTSATKYWDLFTINFRRRHCLLIRRQIQRLVLLLHHQPVPCSYQLDESWLKMEPSSQLSLIHATEFTAPELAWLSRHLVGNSQPS